MSESGPRLLHHLADGAVLDSLEGFAVPPCRAAEEVCRALARISARLEEQERAGTQTGDIADASTCHTPSTARLCSQGGA